MKSKTVKIISESDVKPHHVTEEMLQPHYLTPWDLAMVSVLYIQKGLLYTKPTLEDEEDFIDTLLNRLKQSLSLTLVHFYPLAGRFKTSKTENPQSYVVYVDLNDSPGAKLIHASLDMTMSEIISPTYVPLVVQSLFDHDRAINHDGHTRPLFSIQLTNLVDGIFIGCSMNHALGDGTSYWNFLKAYSEIFKSQSIDSISRPPVIKPWFVDGYGPIINLPFTHEDEFLSRHESPPQLLERYFHFTAESIARLKARANAEMRTNKESEISSFQSLSALVWRSITRARRLSKEQTTSCMLAINNRSRLRPPLSDDYFGNSLHAVRCVATAGELIEKELGWAAWKVHEAVVEHDDGKVREFLDSWKEKPFVVQLGMIFDSQGVMMGSSPRFDKYGVEFGLGKAVTLRSGYAHKFDGKVSSYPGREGGGSVDLEVCLFPESMHALESDHEFMASAS